MAHGAPGSHFLIDPGPDRGSAWIHERRDRDLVCRREDIFDSQHTTEYPLLTDNDVARAFETAANQDVSNLSNQPVGTDNRHVKTGVLRRRFKAQMLVPQTGRCVRRGHRSSVRE
jgi:hypothetical protein